MSGSRNHHPPLSGFLVLLVLFLAACATVPITGRRQLSLIPSQQLLAMSFQSYEQFLAQNKRSSDPEKTALVAKVGQDLKQAVEQYLAGRQGSAELGRYDWTFTLIEDETVNAWAMPGGKVVVYEGMLPVAEDATGLAVVMGHEIAHVIANHGNERMSQTLAVQMSGMALSQALANQPQQTQQLFMAAFGAGAQVGVLLPYSRLQESEADHLGLVFMAMAGYDPRAAIPFWQRMMAQKEGAPPEFLSTHPSGESRIQQIRQLLPEVLPFYTP